MKNLLLILGCLVSSIVAAQSPTEKQGNYFESLIIENYTITNEISAHTRSKQNPNYGLQVNLSGQPASDNFSATSATINFFYGNDPRLNQKPVYNEKEKSIVAHYPIEAFDHWINMLELKKKKKTELTFNFISLPSQAIEKAFLKLEGSF